MAHELPEFSDDLAHCDPCGWPEADTEYVPAIVGQVAIERRVNPFGGGWPVVAFLKRTCTRCGFQWAEAPLLPQVPDQLCDVTAFTGGRCTMPAGHFDIGDPHRFGPNIPEKKSGDVNCRCDGPTMLLGQGDCQGPCCGGKGPVNYNH